MRSHWTPRALSHIYFFFVSKLVWPEDGQARPKHVVIVNSIKIQSYDSCVSTDPPTHINAYTGCPRRNVPDFGRVFLMLKYTDITQNTYVQSWMVMEIMAREKCGLLVGPRTVPVSWQHYPCLSLNVVSYYGNSAQARSKLLMYFLLCDKVGHVSAWHSCHV